MHYRETDDLEDLKQERKEQLFEALIKLTMTAIVLTFLGSFAVEAFDKLNPEWIRALMP